MSVSVTLLSHAQVSNDHVCAVVDRESNAHDEGIDEGAGELEAHDLVPVTHEAGHDRADTDADEDGWGHVDDKHEGDKADS